LHHILLLLVLIMASDAVVNDVEMDIDDQNDNLDSHSLLNKAIASIPEKVEDCDKMTFFLYLLVIVETQNMNHKEKIDFLLLFNFMNNDNAFDLNVDLFGAEFLFKISSESFLQSFFEKTDFDTDRLSKIYDVISTNDTTETIKTLNDNLESLDEEQIWMKFTKCTADLKRKKEPEPDPVSEEKESNDSKEEEKENDDSVKSEQIENGKESKNKKSTKKEKENKVTIRYKIRDFTKLVEYIGTEFTAPEGRNRNGIGAQKYAMAQINGPGGNLTKFIKWDKARTYSRFHHSHYDWWMFPNDRDSWGQGRKYAVFQEDIDALLDEVEGYLENYKLGTRLVLRSWGWNMDEERFYEKEEKTKEQRWTGYNVRLLKMLYSTIILKQWDVYRSVYKFCIGLLEQGEEFRSEPMMYQYLGIEKPKFTRRSYW